MDPKTEQLEPLDLAHWQLALERKRRTEVEGEAAAAELRHLAAELARKYDLAPGEGMSPNGQIHRATAAPPPTEWPPNGAAIQDDRPS